MKNLCPRCGAKGLYRDLTEIACLYCGERIYPGWQIEEIRPESHQKGMRRKAYKRTKRHTEKPQTYWVA